MNSSEKKKDNVVFKIFNKLFFKIIISQLIRESWNSMKRFLFSFFCSFKVLHKK